MGGEAKGITGTDGEGVVFKNVSGGPGNGMALRGVAILEGTSEGGGICCIERHAGEEKVINGAGGWEFDALPCGWDIAEFHCGKKGAAALNVDGRGEAGGGEDGDLIACGVLGFCPIGDAVAIGIGSTETVESEGVDAGLEISAGVVIVEAEDVCACGEKGCECFEGSGVCGSLESYITTVNDLAVDLVADRNGGCAWADACY